MVRRRGAVRSGRAGAGAGTRKASDALVDAVGGLADHAIDRMLLRGERVTCAAQGRLLSGCSAKPTLRRSRTASSASLCSRCLSFAYWLAAPALPGCRG